MTDLAVPVPDSGLGNAAYLVDLGDGRALAVDPCRDLRDLRREAEARGLRVAYAADTHLHADFLSGAVQLSATDGAEVLASRAGRREFGHRGLEDGDEVDLGGLTLRAIATPGHTDEHLSFLLLDGSREIGVFTGGSLIVGSAARVDLVDPDRTEELARAQHRSLHRLARLDDATALWPTHGGGSFCSVSATPAGAASTIGAERASNPLLQAPDEDTFVDLLLGTHGSRPAYFDRLGELNRRGPAVIGTPPVLEQLSPTIAAELVRQGAELVDVRPIAAFAAGHPRGALSITLRPAFASWLGWLVAADTPVVVLRDQTQDAGELLWQAIKIGFENIRGEVAGGFDAWAAAGLPTAAIPLVDPGDVGGRVLDVRQASEYAAGHVPGAIHRELGSLATDPTASADLPDAPTVVMCGHGERAMSGASLLARAGAHDVSVLAGGPGDLSAALGLRLEDGR